MKESELRLVTRKTDMDSVCVCVCVRVCKGEVDPDWKRRRTRRDTLIYLRLNLVFNMTLWISDDSLTPIHQDCSVRAVLKG